MGYGKYTEDGIRYYPILKKHVSDAIFTAMGGNRR